MKRNGASVTRSLQIQTGRLAQGSIASLTEVSCGWAGPRRIE